MKKESEYCSCIVKSLNESGNLGFKIPDPTGQFSQTIKRCFDIIGRIDNKPLYIEAKFNKEPSAFNLNRIEEHQCFFLDEFAKIPDAVCLIALGVQWGRGDLRSFLFEWRDLSYLYKKGFSFHKKELEKLPYNKVSKGVFDFNNIINKETIVSIYGGDIYD